MVRRRHMSKQAWITVTALVIMLGAAVAHAATPFEKEGRALAKAARDVACRCNLNDRMGQLIANPIVGVSLAYTPACRIRTFNPEGVLTGTSNCTDFEVLR
jgi:hypothetical protein